MSPLRPVAEPFVVAPPSGARVRTRLKVGATDGAVLQALGDHLGSLAGEDLALRCAQGKLNAKERSESRRERKRALTARSSSRWAGTITRTSEDAWQLAYCNLLADRRSLQSRINRVRRRLSLPVGARKGKVRGYASPAERFEKQRRLQALEHRLAEVERRTADGRVAVCRGGGRLAKARHNLDSAGLTEAVWRDRWRAERLFITADGEASQRFGNLTIRWHPVEEWLELRLPKALEHLANRPGGRYRLSCPVTFPYRGEEVAAQAVSDAVRYDVASDAETGRWYCDASWQFSGAEEPPTLEALRRHPVLAVDLNHGHLAACVVDPSGNPFSAPFTVLVDLAGLPAPTRDGRLRAAISELIQVAKTNDCRAIVIEDLDFVAAREEGREKSGGRPSRGKRGKSFRRLVAGLPTAKFRSRLVQMATNQGLAVVAVDPAYTSKWGAQHWLAPLQKISTDASGHHAAAMVIGRRGLGHRARRRERCDSTRAEHREERATNSAVHGVTKPIRKPVDREARGQLQPQRKTRPAERATAGDQVAEDRSRPPTGQDPVLLSA